jgi:hypothetical protein
LEVGKFLYENIQIIPPINTSSKNKQIDYNKSGKAGKKGTEIEPVKIRQTKPQNEEKQ